MFNPIPQQKEESFTEEAQIKFILGRLEQDKKQLSTQGTLWWRTTQAQQYLIQKLQEKKEQP